MLNIGTLGFSDDKPLKIAAMDNSVLALKALRESGYKPDMVIAIYRTHAGLPLAEIFSMNKELLEAIMVIFPGSYFRAQDPGQDYHNLCIRLTGEQVRDQLFEALPMYGESWSYIDGRHEDLF